MTTITDQIIEEIQGNNEWNSKMDRQVDLEEKMRGMGVDRHWSIVEKAREHGQETRTKSVRRLMNQAVVDMMAGLNEFLEAAGSGKAGKKHAAFHLLNKIEPEVASFITARAVLDSVAKGDTMVAVARRVGMMIEDELAFRSFKEQDKNAHDWLVKREEEKHSGNYERQRKVMYHNMNNREIEFEDWTPAQQTAAGGKLIEIMMETTGMVEQVTYSKGKNQKETKIVATKEAMDWIAEENNRAAALAPVYLPTVVPPKPWTSPTEGGYWTPRVRRLKLIKTNTKPYLEELEDVDMPRVYDAVNAMQHTAWQIKPEVISLMRDLWNSGSTLGDVPAADDYELPPKPAFLDDDEIVSKEDWTEAQMEEFKSWKRAATDIYVANDRLKSLRLAFAKILMVAETFESEDEIYFPHQLDFRGRCYAVPMFLNPQGNDIAKGLLEFADAAPINDEEGRGWLAVHGSNLFGFDKATLDDRVRWVEEHQAQIMASADDPFSNRFWTEADEPFQFFAFCVEWTKFQREGWGFMSTLPVQMDGSCNGLQNFSAMLRDEVGGEAVNLVPKDLPADVYQRVADKVLVQVEADAASDDENTAKLAQGWLTKGVNRKVCKRPVMTLAYGAKKFGFKKQVFEDTVAPAKFEMGADFPWPENSWGAADYMGGLIWSAVGEVVVAARQAMDWLQNAARAAAKQDLPVRWETPDGLPILQAYPKPKTKRLNLTFGGQRLRLTVVEDEEGIGELDRTKQANGISPNWVHSMDASHMRCTVTRCWEEGIRGFALVHDSYGTHAANAWALADFLREEFIAMYEGRDVLADFKAELEMQLPEDKKLEELPPKGNLDLSQVLESDFFFA